MHDLIHIFLDNGVMTTPKRRILSFVFTVLCLNSLIRIENRPFFYTSWLKAGVKEVRDLLNQDQTFLSYNAFVAKYNIKTNYLESVF